MSPIVTNITLDPNDIINLKDIISENATDPHKEGIAVSGVAPVGAYCSTYSPYLLGDDSFDFLKDMVHQKVSDILHEEVNVFNWWVMKYKGDDHVEEHGHGSRVQWVAVYYIDAPHGSGELYFPDINVSIKPKTGMLVIHPADLVHGVRKNSFPDIERYNMVVNFRTDGVSESF